eukprot:COSAG01_NODE_45977_length_404_cov_1.347541_1_plen_29_part_10
MQAWPRQALAEGRVHRGAGQAGEQERRGR